MSDNLPAHPGGASGLPSRRLSTQELEAVIRRAHELQLARDDREEGLSEAEVLQIGRELGLSVGHVRQALAEVSAPRQAAERGAVARVMGPSHLSASRAVPGEAGRVREQIERYLLEVECMVIARRHPDRTAYERGRGLGPAFRRAVGRANTKSRYAPFKLEMVEVSVQPLEAGYALVTAGVDLRGARTGLFAAGATVGGVGSAALATFLGIAVDPLAALLALPVLPAGVAGMRAVYGGVTSTTAQQLESFLDRVQHGELHLPQPPDWRKRFGI